MAATEKGKISRREWPVILSRFRGGERLSDIARSYGCTAPAIRYIVKRAERVTDGASNDSAADAERLSVAIDAVAPEGPDGHGRAASAHPAMRSIDAALRDRVNSDISAFLVAFDTALAADTPANRVALCEATDRLLRAGARTRIALERAMNADERNGSASAAKEPASRRSSSAS